MLSIAGKYGVVSRKTLYSIVCQTFLHQPQESVDHYPILTAVTGIMVELISRGSPSSRELTTRVILEDPSFQISSIEYLLEEESAETAPSGNLIISR